MHPSVGEPKKPVGVLTLFKILIKEEFKVLSFENLTQEQIQELINQLAVQAGLEIEIKDKQEKPVKRQGRKLPRFLHPEEVAQLLKPLNVKCITGLRNRTIFESMYRAGLRVSEVCNLTPSHVDLIRGTILIQDGKNNTDRIVPITNELMKWLKKWDAVRPESPYFFSTLKGGKLDPRQLNATLERLSQKSGVYIQDGVNRKPVSCHVLRHSYATELLKRGINIRELQDLLGHRNIQTTEIYTHVVMTELDKKIKSFDDF